MRTILPFQKNTAKYLYEDAGYHTQNNQVQENHPVEDKITVSDLKLSLFVVALVHPVIRNINNAEIVSRVRRITHHKITKFHKCLYPNIHTEIIEN